MLKQFPVQRPSRSALRVAYCVLALSACSAAMASDEDVERENLARIANEIAHVKGLVAAAASKQPTGQRVKFRYDWLQRDLQLIEQGIAQHTDAPRQPRPVPPLRWDYRQ
jgi:RAQPRD family integrative conjugative element protein